MTLRVLLADDHDLFREGLVSLLESHGIDVAGQAQDGRAAVALARTLRPDVVLMDLTMPVMGGLEATQLISAEMPEIRVVILTVSEADGDLFEAIRGGAEGYLVKSTSSSEFFSLIDALEQGAAPVSRGLASKILRRLAQRDEDRVVEPTPREEEILLLVAEGRTNREIAETLTISETTVKFHMTNILRKLHLHNRSQVVAYAHRQGLTPPEPR